MRETELFFEAMVKEDRSILDFLDADFTFVNERLAKHYGIPGVRGEEFRRVSLKGTPLTVTAKVTRITDGEFTVTGPMATGVRVRMGRTAVLDTGAMQIVVSERRAEPSDLGVFTHAGIDPRRKHYVLIKSRQHFRAGFEPIAWLTSVAGSSATPNVRFMNAAAASL